MHTSLGDIRGLNESTYGVRRFFRIPYAIPPVGPLRFRPPRPATFLSPNPFPATSRTYIPCIETSTNGSNAIAGSEDCLTLDITLPSADTPPPATGWPVLFYIYGGGFTQAYPEDASSWVGFTQSFIFVSINYRSERRLPTHALAPHPPTLSMSHPHPLTPFICVVPSVYRLGVLGFFSLPELSAEASGPFATSGNQGLRDQTLALQWVHDHIANFSGDPSRVFIQGQSAGSQSVCLHLVMPASRGFFAGGILESHGCDEYGFPLAYGERNTGGRILALSNCSGVASTQVLGCLRTLSAENLWSLVNRLDPIADVVAYHYFQPVWDGVVIPQPPKLLFERGDFSRVPLLIGSNYWEIIVWLYNAAQPFSRYNYTWTNVTRNILFYGNGNATIDAYYKARYGSSVDLAFIESLSTQRFHCPTRRVAQAYAAAGLDVFLYLFDYLQVGDSLFWLNHAGHSAELNSVFNHSGSHRVEEDYRMSAEMQNMWTRFVLNSNPSIPASALDAKYQGIYLTPTHNRTLPVWPPFTLTGGETMYIRNEQFTNTSYHYSLLYNKWAEECDGYWTPNVVDTAVTLRYQQCLHGECHSSTGGNVCVDNFDNSYHCVCGGGWAPVSNATDCALLSTSSSSAAAGPTGTSSTTPPLSTGGVIVSTAAPAPSTAAYDTSSSWSSSSGAAGAAGATCDAWCIVAIGMIVALSIGFIAALYRLYHSSSNKVPPRPPQAVPAATPRPPRATRPRPRPPVESVNTTLHYAPVTPVLQANPYEGGMTQVPVLQANPYEGSLAPVPTQHVVDVAPVLVPVVPVVGAESPAGGERRKKKKVKRQIRIDTGEGGVEPLLPAQPRRNRPVV